MAYQLFWDVSNVTEMSSMFGAAISFNQDISNWDVSNVTDMSNMFLGAKSFNQDIGKWDNNSGLLFEKTMKFTNDLKKYIEYHNDTAKFTNELKKYIESHNDRATITVYPSAYGVREEFIHKGQKKFNYEKRIYYNKTKFKKRWL